MQPTYRYPLSHWLDLLARVAFSLTIILAPLRWRIVLWERPTYPVYGDYTDFLLYASDITLIYTLVFWGASVLITQRKPALGSPFISFSIVGLTLAGFVSTLGGEDFVLSMYQAIRLLVLFLFYLYIVNEIGSPLSVLIPICVQIAFQAFVAIGQSRLQESVGLASLGELRLDPNVAGVSIVPFGELRFLRAYGLTDHPNILGGCLAFGLVLLFAWMMYGTGKYRWLALTAFLPGLLALVMTFSRSAWLGFLIGTSFMVGFEAVLRRWASIKRSAVLATVSLLVLIPFLHANPDLFKVRISLRSAQKERFEQQSLDERMFLIRSGNTVFVEHSAIGIGLGASPLAMKSRFTDFPTNFQPPHYTLLAAAMETGVLGATFYFLLMIVPVILFLSRSRIYAQQPMTLGVFALLLSLLVVGFFDYYPWLNQAGRIWQWLAWGLFSAERTRTT